LVYGITKTKKGKIMGQLVSDITEILDNKETKKDTQKQRQEILSQMAADDIEKNNIVKKALATQRAKYGASGRSSGGITEGAVLKRLRSETSAPYEEKRNTNLKKLKNAKAKTSNLLKSLLSRFDKIVG
jgi:hypothetical protein